MVGGQHEALPTSLPGSPADYDTGTRQCDKDCSLWQAPAQRELETRTPNEIVVPQAVTVMQV
jgi:hypothetical protein